jgi:Ni/Fe-hydrogenase subunit HybB-like protein
MVVGGVVLNRLNVFVIGYKPLYADQPYVPAWTEILVTVGFISILTLLYRFFVFHFPVLDHGGDTHHA